MGETCTCRACTGEWGMLTGVEKHDLEHVKARFDPVLDGPPEPVPALGPDGMIYGERPSMNDQLMYMIASWIWKEATGEWE
jgi:hypothetical protein